MLSCLSFFKFLVYAKDDKKNQKPTNDTKVNTNIKANTNNTNANPNAKKKSWFQLKHIKVNHPKNGYKKEYNSGKAWCFSQEMKDCYIKSDEGLTLHAKYLPANDPKRTIILCHGYRGSAFGDFAYISRFLHENQCNLLFIDQRCMGESEGEYITFGAKEKYDIANWAWYVGLKTDLPIYLYGQSMGGSAVLMSSGLLLPPNVHGIISDCAFHDMKNQLKTMANDWFHLKRINILLFRVNIFCKMFANFQMNEADTTKALQKNTRPILFFHGTKDTYVSFKNSVKNYELCRAPKDLVLVNDARHLCSAYVEPNLYRKNLLKFFNKYD
ncbi:MAG: alpha/beta hydrolase [Lachnospiraceae bacterium]|nr:alpha/beta hydrolase [Lachnospiraceae bacterium]